MMNFILIVRIIITLTFLLLAIFGPVALLSLHHFMGQYKVRHDALAARVSAIEQHVGIRSPEEPHL